MVQSQIYRPYWKTLYLNHFCFFIVYKNFFVLDTEIRPTITILQPTGPFYCPDIKNFIIGPEAALNVPFCFTPKENELVVEYVELRAGKTIYPLKISGKGVDVIVTMKPEFLVYRLEAPRGGRTMLSLEVIR